jgi:hypothetical protein
MTITSGSNILASDFNDIAGPINAFAPYPSAVAATAKVAALYGIGYGDRGYGQKAPLLSKKTVGNPHELLWLCTPSGDGEGDGGWNTDLFTIDTTKKYRSTVWFRYKLEANQAGRFYHGLNNALLMDGTLDSNPYWHYPPEDGTEARLVPGQWYLSVGVLHEAGYAGANSGLSGIYDIHGNKVVTSSDYKIQPGNTSQRQRVYHYYDSTTTQRQWLARPRFEMITGTEPSITTLLSANYDTVSVDTMVKPSQWVNGTNGSQGSFGANGLFTENKIVMANMNGEIEGPTGSIVKGQDYVDLRTAIELMGWYQGTTVTSLPSAATFAPGANVNTAAHATLASFASTIDTNRLNAAAQNMSVTTNALTVTRSGTWGTNAAPTLGAEITVTFPSEDAARFFFNSAGTINMVLSHPSTATSQDANWNSILSALGTIAIGARATTRTGTGGTPAALGYYNLTTAYQTVFNGTNIGGGAYAANDVTVNALVQNVAGVNGGNGTVVKIQVLLSDQHTNAWTDLVQGGTAATFGFKKAAASLTGIVSPSFATVTNF